MPEPKQDKTDGEIMFPAGASYKLRSGDTVHVMPWSVKMIQKVSQRMPDLIERAAKVEKEQQWSELVPEAVGEVAWLIDQSVAEFKDGDAAELLADDFLGLTIKVYDECLAGPLAKIGALGARARAFMRMAVVEMPSESPSSS